MQTRRQTISACCITAGPLDRVAAICARYRPIVDELIIAVDGRFADEELVGIKNIADKVISCEMRADFLQEHYRSWMYAQCSGDWILTFDSDEVPSAALATALPNLAAARDVVTYITTVRWSFPDLGHWLDEYPWHPSWKLIMARNDPATLYIKGGVHEGVQPTEPYRYIDLPIYHLDTAITPLDVRKKKVGFYDSLAGIQVGEDGKPISERYYLPELHAQRTPVAAPAEDVVAMQEIMAAQSSRQRILDRHAAADRSTLHPATISYEEVMSYWPNRPFGPTAYQAKVSIYGPARTPFRDLNHFVAGETRSILVNAQNNGDETWLRNGRNDVALSSRWFRATPDATNPEWCDEGIRSAFTASVHPGETFLHPLELRAPSEPGHYRLVIDLVHEHVRWFDSGVEQLVEVVAR